MKKSNSFLSRSDLNGLAIFRNIQELLSHLQINSKPEYQLPPSGTPSHSLRPTEQPPVVWSELTDSDLKRYGLLISTQLKLLSKVLPDLKSVEFNDVSQGPELSDIELAQKLAALVQEENLHNSLPGNNQKKLN
jgi:hypothetical protein